MIPITSDTEGFAVLYDGTTGTAIVPEGRPRMVRFPDRLQTGIGYLAYPNPTLKNEIPDQRFYAYDRLTRRKNFFPAAAGAYRTTGRLQKSVTKARYVRKIKQIKNLLAAGEVYQINYAIRFRKQFFGDPYALFARLSATNPSAFAAYLNCGSFQIVSASPERLLRARDGVIMTQPIKGTIKKSDSLRSIAHHKKSEKQKDPNLKKLIDSEKERAELDMITDLSRNDIGRVCDYGTLKLTKERAVMELPNLWHTYSEVRGRLRSDVQPKDVLSALFPGGSVTGCPKVRAMEYIERLEEVPRNIFTGSIGYVADDIMDFNIAIRTFLIRDGMVEFFAGGGIVADSDPDREYAECLLKAERLLAIL